MLERMWQKRSPYTLLVGMKISTSTVEHSMEIPQKTRDRTAIRFSDTASGHLPKRMENRIQQRHLYTNVHCSAIHNSWTLETIQFPVTDEWIMKLYIYTMEYYLVTRNNDKGFRGKWMQLEDIMLSEVNQDQKHKSFIFSFICGR
jgi:hypothetical protein